MKHGRKLTRIQKEILVQNGYDYDEWLLERQTEFICVYINRNTNELITLEKNKQSFYKKLKRKKLIV